MRTWKTSKSRLFFASAVWLAAAACSDTPTTIETAAIPPKQIPIGPPSAALPGDCGTVIDMTQASAECSSQAAIFRQGAFEASAGTGVVNPFLKTNVGNTEAFDAFNTSATNQNRPTNISACCQFSRDLPLNWVPQLVIDGVKYREFRLDINQIAGGASALLSLDVFKVYITDGTAVQNPGPGDPRFVSNIPDTDDNNLPNFPGAASLVYDLDAGADRYVKMNFDLEAGSGVGDVFFYIPESVFPAGCDFNGAIPGQECGKFLTLVVRFGDHHVNNDGFEEFAVRVLPYASKTAAVTNDQNATWTIDKKIKKSSDAAFGNGPVTCDLWTGNSCTINYQVSVDKTLTPTNNRVSGTITIVNPLKVSITVSVTDVFDGQNVTVSCPATTVAANSTMVCTYDQLLAGAPTLPKINVASISAVLSTNPPLNLGAQASATVTSSTLGQTTGYATINVDDVLGASTTNLGSASDDKTYPTYDRTFTCDADRGSKTNTATIVETGLSDATTAIINCYNLTIAKTAVEAQGDVYDWTIDKAVTPASRTMYTGDQGEFKYTITLTKTGPTSTRSVSGQVTIANPASSDGAISVAAPTDQILDGGAGKPAINVTLDCGATVFPTSLAAGAQIVCSYGPVALPTGDDRTNRASVQGTVASVNKSFQDDETVTFAGVTPSTTNNSVNYADPADEDAGTRGNPISATTSFDYIDTQGCGDSRTVENTATITSPAGTGNINKSDGASITLTCVTPTVTKTADTDYDRTWTWDILKKRGEGMEESLILQPGQSFNYVFVVNVSTTGNTVSNAKADGNITVTGASGVVGARSFTVTDVLTPALNADPVVSCPGGVNPFTITGNASVQCTWTKNLGADITTARSNTATATLQNVKYLIVGGTSNLGTTAFNSNAAALSFDATPTNAIDECVSVGDLAQLKLLPGETNLGDPISENLTAAGNVCVNNHTAAGSYNADLTAYETTIGPLNQYQACGLFRLDNTATLTTVDLSVTAESDLSTPITVDCPEGCTLTQGYWKTHNALFGADKKQGRKGPPIHDWSDNVAWTNWQAWRFFGGTPTPVPSGNPAITPVPTPPTASPTWFTTFVTPPKGNPYYQAAHQFMAATLNVANGASGAVINDALYAAYNFFLTANPNNLTAGEKSTLLTWNGLFGSYNEGLIGPGHCSEDRTSQQ